MIHFEPWGIYFQFSAFGWTFIASITEEPMFGVEHPDGRFCGFWFEDFQFDTYLAVTYAISENIKKQLETQGWEHIGQYDQKCVCSSCMFGTVSDDK